MSVGSIVLWGFIATAVLTTTMSLSQGLGLSRMSIPFMLGTMFTDNRDLASVLGFMMHFVNGWLLALAYAAVFEALHRATWLWGAALGTAHCLFVLGALMPIFPAVHPRMATERQGPEPTRALEPPGFMALNYGRNTPLTTLLAHLLYGAILGAFYRLGA